MIALSITPLAYTHLKSSVLVNGLDESRAHDLGALGEKLG